MKLSFRWYGEDDKVTLEQIRQIPGMEAIVTAVYDVPVGEVWSEETIANLKASVEKAGLKFEVKMCIRDSLATIAISYIVQNGAMLAWGSIALNFPSIFKVKTIKLGSISVQPEAIMCFVVALICMFILHLYMTKTKLGTSMRAASMDAMAAESCGIDVSLSLSLIHI